MGGALEVSQVRSSFVKEGGRGEAEHSFKTCNDR